MNKAGTDQTTGNEPEAGQVGNAAIPPTLQQNVAQLPGQVAVQLSGAQLEEAKLLTAGKMKVYRKDRLFANDKEKVECLGEVLKNVRITDEAAFFANAAKV